MKEALELGRMDREASTFFESKRVGKGTRGTGHSLRKRKKGEGLGPGNRSTDRKRERARATAQSAV